MALVLAPQPHPVRDHASRVTRAGSVLTDSTNVHRRIRLSASTKHYNLLSSRPSKAPPTLSISATCVSSLLSQALLPSTPDVRSVIPFPSTFPADASITDIVMLDGTIDNMDPLSLPPGSFSPCNGTTSPCSAQTRLRKRRSQAIATLSPPKGPRRDKKAKSKENNTSPDLATRKRSRKSWRQVADLMFLATVHRSLVSRLCDSGAYGVEGDPVDAQTLEGQDVLLARRIQKRLIDHYGCSLVLDGVPAAPHDNDASIRLSSGQDFCRSLHPKATQSPSLPSNTPPPRSSPPPTSDPIPSILTMPQLVASLMMRYNDRCGTRSRPSWRARRAELSSGRSIERKSPLSAVAYASCS
jgi:hypothetical protein